MKERPILFSGEMVRAILKGRKTQTRRVVKPQGAILSDKMARSLGIQPPKVENAPVIPCPYGQPGDRLWVRETFAEALGDYAYRANYSAEVLAEKRNKGLWKPSIHMPRIASRITLEIVSVRVERLQDISEEDAKAEGIRFTNGLPVDYRLSHWIDYMDDNNCYTSPINSFKSLWQSINGAESWGANPWVWVVEFRRVKP